ncbi:MAG: AAA family ATPase [Opitutaceae bacterium]|nr:AAA family ATPase [Opitutaceae bacterium]
MVSQLSASAVTTGGNGSATTDRLRRLPSHLAAKIRGQQHALPRICSVLTRGELGFAHPRRPRGSFLLVGPTGVGKTETTNVFTDYLFDGAAPVRFDMSEYQLQGSVDKLLGESRDDRGLLGRALRTATRGTLLFDEVEKAHPLVLDLFLQILEDARVTLATGETLDLRPFYIVCTSNIGSEETMRMESAPFASVERTVLMRVRERLRPELVGRVNEIVVFGRLDYATQRAICAGMIESEIARLSAMGHTVEVSADAIEFLVRQGYHRSLGARPMRGAVERFMQDALADALLRGEKSSGQLVVTGDGSRLGLIAPTA